MLEIYDLLIVGAGPAGLSASYSAKQQQIKYICLEAKQLVNTIVNYPLGKALFTSSENLSIGENIFLPTDHHKVYREELLTYYQDVVQKEKLNILMNTKVSRILREKYLFAIETKEHKFYAKKVILAIGMQSAPRYLNIPGENLAKVYHKLVDPKIWQKKKILIVGGGDTAVECALALLDDNSVRLSYRKDYFSRLTKHNQQAILSAKRHGQLQIIFNSELVAITETAIVLKIGTKQIKYPNDVVFILIGFETPRNFLENIGLQMQGSKPFYHPQTYESSISGLFVAGDLTFEPLIANAIRHGRQIVEMLFVKQ